ncbi:hypothetical protein [Vibrio sp. J383]|uniref:hypothetical protein n=1 Tax=Vibrio sp. J383 TaxID=2942997 RepID=UPI0020BECE75|nr:hypothetical protein [Vibrio sp. J383]UQV24863.1 hypothetical protein M4S28_26390 [Vibrio sp. J383]
MVIPGHGVFGWRSPLQQAASVGSFRRFAPPAITHDTDIEQSSMCHCVPTNNHPTPPHFVLRLVPRCYFASCRVEGVIDFVMLSSGCLLS